MTDNARISMKVLNPPHKEIITGNRRLYLTPHISQKNNKGYSILDPEGGGNGKKNKNMVGGSRTKIKHGRGSGKK